MAVALDPVAQGSRSRIGAGEDFHVATTVIVEPLDAPLTGQLAVLENLGWLCCFAFALPANAVMKVELPEVGAGRAIISIAQYCPPGTRWVPAGYQRKGKWKPARCSTWVPR
jgi:hypothetical protein